MLRFTSATTPHRPVVFPTSALPLRRLRLPTPRPSLSLSLPRRLHQPGNTLTGIVVSLIDTSRSAPTPDQRRFITTSSEDNSRNNREKENNPSKQANNNESQDKNNSDYDSNNINNMSSESNHNKSIENKDEENSKQEEQQKEEYNQQKDHEHNNDERNGSATQKDNFIKNEKEEKKITGVFTTSYIVQCLIVAALIIGVWEMTSGGRREKEEKVDLRKMKITDRVYMDMAIDDEIIGRVEIGLFGEAAPKTVENFVGLCSKTEGGYQGTEFHKILDGCIQGGDVEHTRDYKGGKSIYGGYFADENLKVPHFPYAVAMANKGPNSNASQFYFVTRSKKELDKKHVVFGIVLRGKDVVDEMERANTDKIHRPLWPIKIASCGNLTTKPKLS
eukprot:gb/GECH01009958.1/.p1 GENE.gb/GECH01009958.1/~~gb/GECH01009958.1/.p1  ORF type:complete len:390 (+),score=83.44 gb/GECH01009958.1/:1-1170(+)